MSTMLLIETIRRQEKKIDDLRSQIKRSESVRKSNRTTRSVKSEYLQCKSSNKTVVKPAQKIKEKDQTINILTERLNRAFEQENEVQLYVTKCKDETQTPKAKGLVQVSLQ
ncbi:unnamed protein product (macronuclear) [Paramecium tetraurelia]|uniref:Uncharacterized protein n=1 Tax=Paramecium tetraurelia TaxID=5888 RepID=A0BTE5_PARTE|nr:uncharacterized protein GSPATT00032044001 [Paramecium tetraurelia]CAK61812.1 unnamed protein product [Paramecium tetraurelia]|eukprot:XP_001429210.1 hypothetical protein (macronuclear) [Paramecium tetraurelia strain d4-2]